MQDHDMSAGLYTNPENSYQIQTKIKKNGDVATIFIIIVILSKRTTNANAFLCKLLPTTNQNEKHCCLHARDMSINHSYTGLLFQKAFVCVHPIQIVDIITPPIQYYAYIQ